MSAAALEHDIKQILSNTLLIDTNHFDSDTLLIGNLAEMDSIGVVMVLTAIQEQFDIAINDDDIDASLFETLATLCEFVASNKK